VDTNSVAFARTLAQIIQIVTEGSATNKGAFFADRLNRAIK
jgi:hypothetical protein